MAFALTCSLAVGAQTAAAGGEQDASRPAAAATLSPLEVVPAVSSVAGGRIEVAVGPDGQTLDYVLHYARLEGAVAAARLRFGQVAVNGGVLAWLCDTAQGPGPAGTPRCPDAPAEISGTIELARVVGPAGQGVMPGAIDEVVQALREGLVYAEVSTGKFPAGELRGQLVPADGGRRTTR